MTGSWGSKPDAAQHCRCSLSLEESTGTLDKNRLKDAVIVEMAAACDMVWAKNLLYKPDPPKLAKLFGENHKILPPLMDISNVLPFSHINLRRIQAGMLQA
jgi:hypothetical protein